MAAFSASSLRLGFWCLPFCTSLAWGQPQGQAVAPAAAAVACAVQPSYPLPSGRSGLEALADKLDQLSVDPACLKNAAFHAWRGAVLVAVGRLADAVEPLERALLLEPDLPGAQLDLAQAFALQGDSASALSLLEQLLRRPDLPAALRLDIDRQRAVLAQPALTAAQAAQATGAWQSRWQLASMMGADSNLNNAPASSEITLTLPQGNVTLPLDASSTRKKGGALMSWAQWQGLRAQGSSVWALQGEVRSRLTGETDTSYQQADLSIAWLQDPAGPRQWVARAGASYLRFGGATLLQAYRASLQHQWDAHAVPNLVSQRLSWGCRPSVTAEFEYRRYPSTALLNGVYQGAVAGLTCRPEQSLAPRPSGAAHFSSEPTFSLQARLGVDRPHDDLRAGGTYRKSELRSQWEGPLFDRGRVGLQLSSTLQTDSTPYSPLLGNVARKVRRHALQLEASWPLMSGLSLIANTETARQRSNLQVFDSRQRSVYLGLRWDLM